MKRWHLFISVFFPCFIFTAQEKQDDLQLSWAEGFKLQRNDSSFVLKFGGSLQIDHAYFSQSNEISHAFKELESRSGTEIRNGRMYFSGQVYHNINFKLQADFANDKVAIKDAYVGISNIPGVGNLRIGFFKEPFRFSSLSGSKYRNFMETASNDSFMQSRNNGAVIYNSFLNNAFSYQVGFFRNANNDGYDVFADNGYAWTGRVVFLPIKSAESDHLLHLGAGYSLREPHSMEYKISISSGSHIAPKYVSTGSIMDVEQVRLVNFELLYFLHSFSLQAEILGSAIETSSSEYHFSNYYTEMSYFITGERKNYLGGYQGYGKLKPKRNFGGPAKGLGAWEIALRYSNTDLEDKDIIGKQKQIAFGVNWYLNPATRFSVNYIRDNINEMGFLNIVQGRFQIVF